MHLLRLPRPQEDKTTCSKTSSHQIVSTAFSLRSERRRSGWLENFFLADLSQSLPSKLHRWNYGFFRLPLDGFPFHSFSADASGQQPSFYACHVAAVCNFTFFIGPFAPHSVSAVEDSFFSTPKQFAFRRTIFWSRQHGHNLNLNKNFLESSVASQLCLERRTL